MPRQSKEPWVSVKITISLKNPPKDYMGWKSQTVSIGQDEPVNLISILFGAVKEIAEWYANYMMKASTIKIETVNQAISEAAVRLALLKFKTEKVHIDRLGNEVNEPNETSESNKSSESKVN
jgi:hypothetical protein